MSPKHKRPQQAQAKAEEPKYLGIKTPFGLRWFHPHTRVYVKIGAAYLPKEAANVQPGDQVVIHKRGLDIDMVDADRVLVESPRYAGSRSQLFQRLENGQYTTAFRYELFDAFHCSQTANLETSALKEISTIIHCKLAEAELHLGEQHIRDNWLGGKTVRPEDIRVIQALLPLAPGLEKLLSESFTNAYTTYMTIRRTVMRTISNVLNGKKHVSSEAHSKNGHNGAPKSNGISVQTELRMLHDYYLADVDDRFAAALVMAIQAPQGNSSFEFSDESVFGGGILVTGQDIEGCQLKLKTDARLEQEWAVIDQPLIKMLYDFLCKEDPTDAQRHGFRVPYLMALLRQRLGHEDNFEYKVKRASRKLREMGITPPPGATFANLMPDQKKALSMWEQSEEMTKWADDFMHALADGTLDHRYGLSEGEALRAFETYYRLESARHPNMQLRDLVSLTMINKDRMAKMAGRPVNTRPEEQVLKKLDHKVAPLMAAAFEVHTAAVVCKPLILNSVFESFDAWKVISGNESAGQLVSWLQFKGALEDPIADDSKALSILDEMGFSALKRLYPKADQPLPAPPGFFSSLKN